MELAIGTMISLAPKLAELLHEEYVVQKGLKPAIESLSRELMMMHAALVKVSRVPPDQLDDLDKLWARQVRELSYDMEDAVDAFAVRVMGREPPADLNIFRRMASKATTMVKKVKDRHQISDMIRDIQSLSKELAELHAKYSFNGTSANTTANNSIDPRVLNLYKNEEELVGTEEARDELIKRLTEVQSHGSDQGLKIVSIVGFGGLGKTTLAKTVYERLKAWSFDCCAFVPVGRNPKMTKFFEDMLKQLDKMNSNVDMARWDEKRFCDELHKFLQDKRYFIVIDDIWDKESWEIVRYALKDSNRRSRIIMTTRNAELVTKIEDVYRLKPLSLDNSRKLFYKRILTGEEQSLGNSTTEVSDILKKCGGVPLAIIAIASFLADKPWEDWSKIYKSMVLGHEDNTMKILSYSYHELPFYLKPCLLYLSILPEEGCFTKNSLIWMWIAEGFIQHEKEGDNLFEVGERYFNALLNRSMIQAVEDPHDRSIIACHLHDIVHDLIREFSREENFFTMLVSKKCTSTESVRTKNEIGMTCLGRKIRRLYLQECDVAYIPRNTIAMLKAVRSLLIMFSEIEMIPPLSSIQACRVLMMDYSHIPNIKHLGKLLHLRYLEIDTTPVDKLPREIGDLKSLQTLRLKNNGLEELPPAICTLPELMCLRVIGTKRIQAHSMGNLLSLEELLLEPITGRSETNDLVVELGKLSRLRAVKIKFSEELEESSQRAIVLSLGNLQKIKDLELSCKSIRTESTMWKDWQPPRQLRRLFITGIVFSRLPVWINPSCIPTLCYLSVSADVVEVWDLENLARLPELLYLELKGCCKHQGYAVGAAGRFKKLKVCRLDTAFKFEQGAMPRLEALSFVVNVEYNMYTTTGGEFENLRTRDAIADLDFGLGNLFSLEQVSVQINCAGAFAADVEEAEAAIRRTVEDHPNRPTLEMLRQNEESQLSDENVKTNQHLQEMKDHHPNIGRESARLYEVEEMEVALRHVDNIPLDHFSIELVPENADELVFSSDHHESEI